MRSVDSIPEASFDVRRPSGTAGPFVFASPHSGCHYPADMNPVAGLDLSALASGEDVGVDRLIEAAPALGAPVIAARISRAYVDLNRSPDDLDPVLILDPVPALPPGPPANRVRAGFGVVPRKAGDGTDLYDRRLTRDEVDGRLRSTHAPYHSALMALVLAARQQHGMAILIDWHSMPSSASRGERGARGPDVVLGDRHGTSCDVGLTRRLRALFEAEGWTVALNRPYAGGYTTQLWGRPVEGIHTLQIELARSLYLDEATRQPSAAYGRCRGVIDRVTRVLLTGARPF